MAGKRKSYAQVAKSNKKRRAKQYAKPQSFAAKVNKLILKQSEAKSSFSIGENINLFHGTRACLLTNLLGTDQGVGAHNRIGDKVHAKRVQMKLWLSNKGDRPNVMYRAIVYKTDFANAGINPVNFFLTQGNVVPSAGNAMVALINTDKYTVVSDRIIQPKNGDRSVDMESYHNESSQLVTINVNLNKAITYSVAGGGTPAGTNIYNFMLIPYDKFDDKIIDNIASVSHSTVFTFSDL
jgi:hypothetical protein